MPGDGPAHSFNQFRYALRLRMAELAVEWAARMHGQTGDSSAEAEFVMPIGLLLAIDQKNGGDVTAQELVNRFNLLHQESDDIIEFFFLGWDWVEYGDRSKGIEFDLKSFKAWRKILKSAGVTTFGGNADLLLVDARLTLPRGWDEWSVEKRSSSSSFLNCPLSLDFTTAIVINLASSREDKTIPPLGELLQSLIAAAESVRSVVGRPSADGNVFAISDRLGLATAKRSFITFILDKFGALIGGAKLRSLAVTKIGPVIDVDQMKTAGVAGLGSRSGEHGY